MTTFQVTLFLDTSGTLRAEGPNSTGSRRKLNNGDPIPHFTTDDKIALANMILEDLEIQKQKEADKVRALHNQNVKYVASNHPGILKHVYPREASHVNPKLWKLLRDDGYTDNEIRLMANNGELVGTAFWQAPKVIAPETNSTATKRPTSREDIAKLSAKLAAAI